MPATAPVLNPPPSFVLTFVKDELEGVGGLLLELEPATFSVLDELGVLEVKDNVEKEELEVEKLDIEELVFEVLVVEELVDEELATEPSGVILI